MQQLPQHDIAATSDCVHHSTSNDILRHTVIDIMDGMSMDDSMSMSVTLKLGTHKELVQVSADASARTRTLKRAHRCTHGMPTTTYSIVCASAPSVLCSVCDS